MKELVNIAFPGLGIDSFTVNKIAFTLFGKFTVRWYGILITLGIVIAFLYAVSRGKKIEKIKFDDYVDLALSSVICGVIGARLYYVLTTLDEGYTFLEALAIWNGGIAIYGAIIGGAIGLFAVCHFKKLKWRRVFDSVAPGVLIAQSVGRWGNFFNGEAFGSIIGDITDFDFLGKTLELPSGKGTLFHLLRMQVDPNRIFVSSAYVHPTFFYESVWNLIGFILIAIFYRKKKYDGEVLLWYLTWYGFGRTLIEGFRSDSLFLFGSDIRISQLIGLLCFVLGGAALLTLLILRKKGKLPEKMLTMACDETEANDGKVD